MANRGYDEWETNREVYTPDQVESVLRELGVEIRDETENDFLSYCPYHGNTDTPAFSTSKKYGYSICFNPSCGVGSTDQLPLEKLVRQILRVDHIAAKRFVLLKKNNDITFKQRFDSVQLEKEELTEFPQLHIDKMHHRFMETPAAQEYMRGRGFERSTMEHFQVGYTPATQYNPRTHSGVTKPDMIVVPAYDHRSRPVGLVGRSIEGKEFKNFGGEHGGKGFHKSKMVWNLNEARKHETLIVTESTFDSMRIFQAGYPNVGALLGGTLSLVQEELIRRHFTRVVIMTDNETGDDIIRHRHCNKCLKQGYSICAGHKPGRDLGMKIAERLPTLRISWAAYNDKFVYANNVKDAAAMTDDEIRQSLRNAISHYEYLDWGVA